MSIRGYLWRFSKGDPVAKVCNTTHHNRVAQILEDIVGVGLHIEKNTDGSPWRIIYDGVTSDEKPADGSAPAGGGGVLGFPWGKQFVFGLVRSSADSITVWNAMAWRRFDAASPYFGDAESYTVAFATAGTFLICWQWTKSTGILTVMSEPQATIPADDSDTVYGSVARFVVTTPDSGVTFNAALDTGGEIQSGSPALIDPWAPIPASPDNQNLVAGTDSEGKTKWWPTTELVDWS